MASPRISGQDTEITVVVDGEPVANITAVKSFTVTWKMTVKSEEYCGETTPRKDDFFEGLSGSIEIDLEGTDALTLIQTIQTRAQNRALTTKIGIKSMLQFPSGDRAIINIPQAFFSDIPVNFASRTDYGKITLSYEAETGRIVSR
jgi:antitoxin (DNA-binding transcriptional repressor) of toxin-antitoxin stability system